MHIVGCGSSFHAAETARYWIEALARIPCSALSGAVSGETTRTSGESVTTAGFCTNVAVRPVTDEPTPGAEGSAWVLTVHGGDRPGIVAEVVGQVAAAGGNITDLTTRLAGDLYLLVAELDLPADADVDAVATAHRSAAARGGVTATLRPAEADEL